MKRTALITWLLVIGLAASTLGFEAQAAYQMREDYGTEPLFDRYLNYYYFIPCPSYSWFWEFAGFSRGDIIGAWFEIGDVSMFSGTAADPANCHMLEQLRILDFAGYAAYCHGCFAVRFDVWCADDRGCPVGPSLWNSGPVEFFIAGWNYIQIDPPMSICSCSTVPGPPPSRPRILITATHVGTNQAYPGWGADDISTPVSQGCVMHDYGCLPALYPRPHNSNYGSLHSGIYSIQGVQYCPPLGIPDVRDTTPDGTLYGFVELAWRIYLTCTGPSAVEPTTWGAIKSMYR